MLSTIRDKSTTLAFCSLLLLTACGGGNSDPTPPPPDPGTPPLAASETPIVEGATLGQQKWAEGSVPGAKGDGVECMTGENYHLHGLVSIYQDGTRLAVPKNIGIIGTCTYELHTHDATGVVHLETSAQRKFTFGQFFTVWGQALGAGNVAGISGAAKFYVIEDGKVTPTSAPADVEITPHRELAIVIGTPPAALVRHSWPKEL
jgi:hypothetical protein